MAALVSVLIAITLSLLIIRKALRRWTDLDLRDYARLLHLRGEYQVMEIEVEDDNWLANKKLKELRLRDEGIAVLGIQRRDKSYIGAPYGDTYVCPGDTLILYGRKVALMELDLRQSGFAGEKAHQQAIATQQQIEQEQRKSDAARCAGECPPLYERPTAFGRREPPGSVVLRRSARRAAGSPP